MTKAWDREKSRMHELYMVRNMKLSQMQEIMREQHGFTASERAYKQKFKEWKWFKKTPRNQGVNPDAMTISLGRPSPTSRSYGHSSADLRRCSDSSSLSSMDHHHGQMPPPTPYPDPSVSPEHSVYPATQHSLLGLGPVHSPQPVVRDTYQISLPPVAELQLLPFKESVKDSVRTAQMHLDSGDLELAGDYLEHSLKTLQWLTSKGCR
ncbi:unnamed protein product [Tuber melanosporum]|jgi:hypothetical protein|uniref:(Perigord truffle) hypothetical protein n=1 Tax=Tuber melanosporum (strain Mel28) TaxID=656061 RepID=D5GIL6_TUBMM|nr:uncharacterized protein GSTUM_00008553001 [Tuber melanosporum]KAG0134676.1 hypothetical protein HOY82DRAFT_553532 [Tuber indicum]CAZ84359.1 unnamed protein product [Tuber melanosporum]